MLRVSIVVCLAVAVLGQQRFGQQRAGQGQFGQTQFGRPQSRQQRFGQQQFGQQQLRQPQPSQQQVGQPQPRQQQFGQQQPRQQQPRQQQFGQQPLAQQLGQPLRQQEIRDPVPILRMNNDQSPDGDFQYGYESADSAVVEAQGEQKQIGDGAGIVMQGSYSYTAPNGELIEVRSVRWRGTVMQGSFSYTASNGELIEVNWIADENGFQPIVSRNPSQ